MVTHPSTRLSHTACVRRQEPLQCDVAVYIIQKLLDIMCIYIYTHIYIHIINISSSFYSCRWVLTLEGSGVYNVNWGRGFSSRISALRAGFCPPPFQILVTPLEGLFFRKQLRTSSKVLLYCLMAGQGQARRVFQLILQL